MFDIHSHFLPGMDDGAKNAAESIELLESMKAQGCSCVIATPHFYPESTTLSSFKKKFSQKFQLLSELIKDRDLPKIFPGCEAYYFNNISSCEDLGELCLNNSHFLLLELPRSGKITDSILNSITDIYLNRGIVPIIAHIERYMRYKNYHELLDLVDSGYARAQINASSFVKKREAKGVIALIKDGIVSYIASDAHSAKRRPVCLSLAYDTVEKELGAETKNKLINNSVALAKEMGIDTVE